MIKDIEAFNNVIGLLEALKCCLEELRDNCLDESLTEEEREEREALYIGRLVLICAKLKKEGLNIE